MSELSSYLTSDYIGRLRHFALDRTHEPVMAYVEGDDDIHFWESALNGFGNTSKFQFRVVTNKMACASSDPNAPNGKNVLLNMKKLGNNKIVCVDADWDLLIDGYSDKTGFVRTNAFVINTTYYALENVLASPEFHESLMGRLGLPSARNEYERLLVWVSRLCEQIFILMMSYAKIDSHDRKFWFTDFGNCINQIRESELGNEGKLECYKHKWEKEEAALLEAQAVPMDEAQQNLVDKGYAVEKLWNIMRGHNLYTAIIRPWIMHKYKVWKAEQIKTYINDHGTEELEVFKTSLGQRLGTYATLDETIDFYFYHNEPNPIWLPEATRNKIVSLFS